ncbi:putative RNA helicase SDE3 [Cinnamomum micranthum f. kanehirae]|uniref:Putative RNA helicase SDE3 n=1 Tax=Cinnamomum micranthum f. kanehirae TaxID=337451 RepID=A0A443PPF5_9MAGN|nr:putative RNA helicase SDE3 [Cinnamomum micranthum f. kanehirae]
MSWLLDILRGVQRYIHEGNYQNPTPDVSAQKEPARTSPPTQPESTPVRVATQTPPPSVSQRNSVDSVRPTTLSKPPEKPSGSYATATPSNWRSPTNVLPVDHIPGDIKHVIERDQVPQVLKKRLSKSDYEDYIGTPNVSATEQTARTSPPTQPKTTPVQVATQTPSPSVSQRNSVDSVRPTTLSKPTEKPSGSYATPSNWRSPTNVLPVYHIPGDIKHVIEKDQVPQVLKKRLTTISDYDDYFAALLSGVDYNMNKSLRENGTPNVSAKEQAARTSPPTQPKTTPARVAAQTPSPSLSQRNSVDSVRPPIISNPPENPSGSYATPSNWRPPNVLPVYHIPGDIKHVIEKDQVPEVLKEHVSPSNYVDYFAALLYAEDYYMEKWSEFLKEFVLSGITLRLREETMSGKPRKSNKTVYMNQMGILECNKEEKKVYVEFDMDSIPERRPFLLAKDYVYVRPSGKTVKPFQGFLSRVEKSKLLLAEFGEDFHAQHSLMNKYDVWFDFNRVCLKRSHQGVAAAVDPSFRGILFPDRVSRSRRQIPILTVPFNRNFDQVEMSAVNQILSLKGPPPYLIVESSLPRSHGIVVEAILQIYRAFKESRILIVAPQNHTCDWLIISLQEEIPVSEMFRANATFRERNEVPEDVLSSSLYEGECFTCPPSEDLRKFKVIASTFMSSFRLHGQGIYAGHFSHIFVVDACYATEPETMVTLANLANESTAVVLTGSSEHYARWVRSDIARANGLRRSYFKRLLESEPYKSRDPGFVKYLIYAQKEPARASPPTQPETTPVRVATQTPPPSVSQRNYVDSVRPTTISKPTEKPSGSYATPSNWRSPTNVLPDHIPGEIKHVIEKDQVPQVMKKRISTISNYEDYVGALLYGDNNCLYKGLGDNRTPNVSTKKQPARTSPTTQPKTTPARVTAQTPPSLSQRNSVDSVRPPIISNPPENPSGSYATPSNWRPPNVLPVYHIPGDIKHVIEKDQVPQVLKKRISTISNYEDYFGALLYGDNNCLYKGLGENRTPNVSTKKQPARTSPPTQPKTTPARVAAQTPSPSLSQRNSVDSVRPPIISNPPENPSGSYATPSNRRPTHVLPAYHIPVDFKLIIEKDQIPQVLKEHVSPSNYVDYFAALLYAEDYYREKWSEFSKEFVLSGITLRLREETISGKSRKSNEAVYMNQMGRHKSHKEEEKVYVEFDMDSINERRRFLLAKDYVYVRRSGETVKPFQGFLSRVEKSKLLLAEFGKDFQAQHSLTNKYDVWFDFNRVCLKRSHQGIAAAVDPSFRGILFPELVSRSRRQIPIFTSSFNRDFDQVEMSAVNQILSLKGPPPYLIVESSPPRSHGIIVEAILQIYRTFKESRILIVAPQNHTCDWLIISLQEDIPVSEMFRANAAFRERDEVPKDVLSSSLYEGECFTLPPSEDLRKFKVIASTCMSSFRLHCHGIYAGHFSHIFVVDACYATEPETMVTLANLANESTAVVLTGSSEHDARWVRSEIASENGLRRSYFKRLLESEPYKSRDPGYVKYLIYDEHI